MISTHISCDHNTYHIRFRDTWLQREKEATRPFTFQPKALEMFENQYKSELLIRSHPRGRGFESLQVHHEKLWNYIFHSFSQLIEKICVNANQAFPVGFEHCWKCWPQAVRIQKTTYRKVRVSVCWFRKTIEPALFLHFQRKNEGVSPEGGTNDAWKQAQRRQTHLHGIVCWHRGGGCLRTDTTMPRATARSHQGSFLVGWRSREKEIPLNQCPNGGECAKWKEDDPFHKTSLFRNSTRLLCQRRNSRRPFGAIACGCR